MTGFFCLSDLVQIAWYWLGPRDLPGGISSGRFLNLASRLPVQNQMYPGGEGTLRQLKLQENSNENFIREVRRNPRSWMPCFIFQCLEKNNHCWTQQTCWCDDLKMQQRNEILPFSSLRFFSPHEFPALKNTCGCFFSSEGKEPRELSGKSLNMKNSAEKCDCAENA